jgi:hypothetical protein
MTVPTETGRFALGDLKLQSGEVLPGATLSWKSYGTLSPSRDNVVVYPTSYSAKHSDQEWLIAPDKVLDPTRWFIVTPDMFGKTASPPALRTRRITPISSPPPSSSPTTGHQNRLGESGPNNGSRCPPRPERPWPSGGQATVLSDQAPRLRPRSGCFWPERTLTVA